MNQKILVFAGKKQSGKSSAAKFVAGYVLSQLGRKGYPFCPKTFDINEDGDLIVDCAILNAAGEVETSNGILDLNRIDDDFIDWAHNIVWPHVKLYSFADELKRIAIHVFGIPEELVYGTDEQKRTLIHIKWQNMCAFLPPKHVNSIKRAGKYDLKMNVREFLQFFGTNICRRLFPDCWLHSCYRNIMEYGSELSIVQDARFSNEIKGSRTFGAKVIKLERIVEDDLHDSEKDIEKVSSVNYDLIIDNQHMTIREKNQVILDALYDWGWLSGHIDLVQ